MLPINTIQDIEIAKDHQFIPGRSSGKYLVPVLKIQIGKTSHMVCIADAYNKRAIELVLRIEDALEKHQLSKPK